MKNSEKSWNEFFKNIKTKDYSIRLHAFLDDEYRHGVCYPPRDLLFNAFKLTPLEEVKVVIIGQDPYHEPGQAMGLSFSVPKGIKVPPSLINIYKEISDEYGVSGRVTASLLDTCSCIAQGIIPYGAQLLIASSLSGISSMEIIPWLVYPFILLIFVVISILRVKE